MHYPFCAIRPDNAELEIVGSILFETGVDRQGDALAVFGMHDGRKTKSLFTNQKPIRCS